MDLSFAILTWNSARYIERCIASIDAALARSPLSYEVLVLDNGSKDETVELLERLSGQSNGRIVLFYEKTNIGTTQSRNRLFAAARGKYLCVMDSDVELGEHVVDTLISMLDEDSGVGLVAPRVQYASGNWQKSFDRFPTLFDKINRFFRLRTIEEHEAMQVESAVKPFVVDYVISAFWLMRRELLRTVGLLDERIFYAPEDVDFCLRVWKSGYRILYVPAVSITHHTQELSRGWKLNKAKVAHLQGLAYYFMKHRYLLRRPDLTKSRGPAADHSLQ